MNFETFIDKHSEDKKYERMADIETLRAERRKLELRCEELKQELKEYDETYRQILEEAKEASESEKKRYAQRAKTVKKKYEITQKRYEKVRAELATVITLLLIRELGGEEVDDGDGFSTEEIDDGELRRRLVDARRDYNLDDDIFREVQETLDIDIDILDILDVGPDSEVHWDDPPGTLDPEKIDLDEIDLDPSGEGSSESGSKEWDIDSEFDFDSTDNDDEEPN